jgi:uncharacterized damage-inducible protein DinB
MVLSSWKAVREDTAQAVEDFPAAEMDYRPTPELMTFRDTARHILDAGQILTGALLDEVDNMATPDFREKRKQYLPQLPADLEGAALARALRTVLETRAAELAARPGDFYALEMLQFVKEHELTHRSQLFMYLRLKGIVPSTTRRRLAKAKA